MCGIAGHFGRPVARGRARRMLRRAARARTGCAARSRPSTPTARGCPTTRRRGADSCTRGFRSSIRARSPTSRWATTMARVWIATTARSTAGRTMRASSKRAARGSARRSRHRVHPARLRGLGHRRPAAAAARHVRVRARRLPHAARARRARPARTEAARLRARSDALRVRLDGAQRAAVAAARPARFRARCHRRVSRASLRPGAAHDLRQHRAAAQCASPRVRPRRARLRASLLGAGNAVRRAIARALLDEAIELRLVADRPLGLFLSGGVDSATIACRLAATGHRGAALVLRGVSRLAPRRERRRAATARALGLPNERIVVPTSIRDDFATIVATLDEPFADPSSFPTWYLAREDRAARQGRAGRRRRRRALRRLQARRQARAQRMARRACACRCPMLADPRPKGWRKVVAELALDWESAYALRFSGLTPNQRALPAARPPRFPTHYWRAPDFAARSRIDRLLRWDFANYLPEYVLRKADLATMAHGLELRAPLLDHRFVEAVLALPARATLHAAAQAVPGNARARARRPGRIRAQEARLQSAAARLAQGATCASGWRPRARRSRR